MKIKKNLFIVAVFAIFLSFVSVVHAKDAREQEYFRAEVTQAGDVKTEEDSGGFVLQQQNVRARITSGDLKGQEVEAKYVADFNKDKALKPGDGVVVLHSYFPDEDFFQVVDRNRLSSLVWIAILFFVAAIYFGRWRGLTSILGLGISILVLILVIVPGILAGRSPVLVSVAGASMIAVVSLFLAHGFKKRTAVALLSTVLVLSFAGLLAYFFVWAAKLAGYGSEEVMYLQGFAGQAINLRGLLLGGIIIGTLGVLDDVTVGQTAVVDELKNANPDLTSSELYRRGLSVGHEHIASLINTLVLAYAGASLSLFLLFSLDSSQPWWLSLNSEFIAEEVVRTLVGSTALVLAVPISTFFASQILGGRKGSIKSSSHVH